VFRHHQRRDRLSTVAALTVSPRRQHLGLYVRWQPANYHAPEVVAFLRALLRHLRGRIVLLWDRASIHRGPVVARFLAAHPRLQVAYFPGYAPELNPTEFVWTQAKGRLANSAPPDLADLARRLGHTTRRLRRSQTLLWACIAMSDLPWAP
jgi:transposase